MNTFNNAPKIYSQEALGKLDSVRKLLNDLYGSKNPPANGVSTLTMKRTSGDAPALIEVYNRKNGSSVRAGEISVSLSGDTANPKLIINYKYGNKVEPGALPPFGLDQEQELLAKVKEVVETLSN